MGVLDWGGDRRRRGSFGGEFGASHCNQWGLCDALFSKYFEDLFTAGVVTFVEQLLRRPSRKELQRRGIYKGANLY